MLTPTTLSDSTGHGIRLEPLSHEHTADLMTACQDGELWQLLVTSVPEPHNVNNYIDKALLTKDRFAFAVIDEHKSQAIGSTSYHDILPDMKRLEIGYTWYAQSYWRSYVNSACKLMLLTHAFETLGYQTVGWRTDIDNTRSQQAIERLGAIKDGVIRGNKIRRNGVITDTVMYSMSIDEWADAKARLRAQLKR